MRMSFFARALGLVTFVLTVGVGCASAPTQEMSDARQAIQAAQDAGAQRQAADALGSAQSLMGKAEQSIEAGRYEDARADALEAKKSAVAARNMALAIAAGEAALGKADKLGAEWRDSGQLLAKARLAAKAGNEGAAIKAANEAKQQGELAVNQHYLEEAKIALWEMEKVKASMTADQLTRYQAADAAYRDHEGRNAYDLAASLKANLGH